MDRGCYVQPRSDWAVSVTTTGGEARRYGEAAGRSGEDAGQCCTRCHGEDGGDERPRGVGEGPLSVAGLEQSDRLEGEGGEGREGATEASSEREQGGVVERCGEDDPEREASADVDHESRGEAVGNPLADQMARNSAADPAGADEDDRVHDSHLASQRPQSTAAIPRP